MRKNQWNFLKIIRSRQTWKSKQEDNKSSQVTKIYQSDKQANPENPKQKYVENNKLFVRTEEMQ